jgi:tetratricopeptide (TPR) repeat protein/tRNA A-37 threonylcarbamoyl transferase component Bud32
MKRPGSARDETLDLEGQKALLSVLRGLGTRNLALRIGRYEIGDVLGHGACGQVIAARDPELDREVAIKVVLSSRERADPGAEARLLREAEALARLQDPHVVPVYDVGIDDIGSGTGAPARRGVYVVMARIRGRTLHERLRDGTLEGPEIVRAFLDAAKGLAAAHAVGVVHRDFKPGNAMITDDGTVVVIDFGLARALDERAVASTERSDHAMSLDASQSFTATGTVMGTPRYMAPEQHAAQPATALVDQYAWCVALWEALSGSPPFDGATLGELAEAKRLGKLPPAPSIPAPLRSVLARGMKPDPRDRWPSMQALAEAWARSAAVRRRRVGLASIGALAVAAGAAWGTVELDRQHRLAGCRAEGESIATIWSSTRADAIGAAFDGTGLAYAPDAWARSRARLDAYAAEWTHARRGLCEAAEVERTMPPDLALASRACLDEHGRQLGALLDQLAVPDKVAVNKAAVASASLPRLAACRDAAGLREWAALPADPGDRSRTSALRSRLAEGAAARATGRYEDALRQAEAVLHEAAALGWSSLSAEARLAAADAYDSLGRAQDARDMAEAAFFEADAAGRDDLALRASSALVFFEGNLLARHEEALEWGRFAQIRAERAGADDLAVARLFTNLGSLHRVRGEYDRALELHERARILYEGALGPEHPEVAVALNNLGTVEHDRGRYADAVAFLQRALAIDEVALGPEHPGFAASLNNLAVVQHRRGDYESALELHTRALAVRERAFGPDHPEVAVSLNNLGAVRRARGQLDEALELYARALAIREKTVGPEHPEIATTLDNLGLVRRERGEHDLAIELHGRALALREQKLGPRHPEVATSRLNLGKAHHAKGEHARAIECYTVAHEIWAETLGAEHLRVAIALENLGQAEEDRGAHAAAVSAYEKALVIRELGEPAPRELAELRFGLARALWDGGGDQARAIELARAAAELQRELGTDGASALAETEVWLATHAVGG